MPHTQHLAISLDPGDGGHGTNVEGNVYQINTLIPRPDGDGYVVRATKTVKY